MSEKKYIRRKKYILENTFFLNENYQNNDLRMSISQSSPV